MGRLAPWSRPLVLAAGLVALLAAPAWAQGKAKGHKVSKDRAVTVVKAVLVEQGFEVVKIEVDGDAQIVYYRRGNAGKGQGKGPVEKMIVRQVKEEIVFELVPDGLLAEIEVKLKLPLD